MQKGIICVGTASSEGKRVEEEFRALDRSDGLLLFLGKNLKFTETLWIESRAIYGED